MRADSAKRLLRMTTNRFGMVACPIAFLIAMLCIYSNAAAEQAATPPEAKRTTSAAETTVVATATVHIDTDSDLLTKAKTAENEKRLYAPAGDNAIEYYLQLRARNPNDESVKSALTDLFPYAMIATEQNLKKGDELGRQEAARIFALLERVDANAPSLPRLRTMMQKDAAIEVKQQQDAAKKAQANLEKDAEASKTRAADNSNSEDNSYSSRLPCLSGVCLGDEIAKYAHSIAWKLPPEKVNIGNSPFSELFLLQNRIIGLPAGSGKNIYLAGNTADALTFDFYRKYPGFRNFNGPVIIPDTAVVRVDGAFILTLLNNNITFCHDVDFRAGFDSSSGYPTWVSFRPDAQGTLRVTELIRDYRLTSLEEVKSIIASLHSEFPFLVKWPSQIPISAPNNNGWLFPDDWHEGPWGGYFKLIEYRGDNELYLAFDYKDVSSETQLKNNPMCPQPVVRHSID